MCRRLWSGYHADTGRNRRYMGHKCPRHTSDTPSEPVGLQIDPDRTVYINHRCSRVPPSLVRMAYTERHCTNRCYRLCNLAGRYHTPSYLWWPRTDRADTRDTRCADLVWCRRRCIGRLGTRDMPRSRMHLWWRTSPKCSPSDTGYMARSTATSNNLYVSTVAQATCTHTSVSYAVTS